MLILENDERANGVLVSLQVPGDHDDLVAHHRATGVLVDQDLVLVPELPRKLLGEIGSYVVLLVPLPVADACPAEVVRPSYFEAHELDGGNDLVFLVVRLARPTALPPVSSLPLPPGEQLGAEALKHGGRIWPILEAAGLPLAGLHEDPSSVLSQVVDRLEAESPRAVKLISHRSPEAYGLSLCDIVPWCEPGVVVYKPPRDHVTWVDAVPLGADPRFQKGEL